MIDDTVLSQPPPRSWIVTVAGHHEDVESFCEEIENVFKGCLPEIRFQHDDDDLVTATIRMVWNSIGLENLLWSMVPDELKVQQKREEPPCQDHYA